MNIKERKLAKNLELLDDETPEAGGESYGPLDTIRVYFDEITKVDLLDAEAEVELAKKIEAGLYAEQLLESRRDAALGETTIYDNAFRSLSAKERQLLPEVIDEGRAAKNQMIEANLRLAANRAHMYRSSNVELGDRIQGAAFGLIRAVEKFDYQKGFKFSTYAEKWLRQFIVREIAQNRYGMRLPTHAHEDISAMISAESRLSDELGREPTLEELAEEMGKDAKKLEQLRIVNKIPVSTNTQIRGKNGSIDGQESELGDFIEDIDAVSVVDGVSNNVLSGEIQGLMAELLEQLEYDAISMKFGYYDGTEMPDRLIAAELNKRGGYDYKIKQNDVRNALNRAMTKLKRPKVAVVLHDKLRHLVLDPSEHDDNL